MSQGTSSQSEQKPKGAARLLLRRKCDFATRAWALVWCWMALQGLTSLAGEPPSAPEPFRVGVSQASFGTVNRNDASAAIKAWGTSIAKERNLNLNVQVEVFETVADWRKALIRGGLNAVSMTTDEFLQSGEHPEFIYLVTKDTGYTEHYVLLARRDGAIENLQALRGRRLARHVSSTTRPALAWIETALAEQNLGRANDFLGEIVELDSPSKAVLRVFFRQSDACIVTTNAFALACEMNPQVQKQLKVLLSSPAVIPRLIFFRGIKTAPMREEFESAILNLHETVAGQQVLTVFQGSRMEKHPLSILDGTRRLFEQYHRLTGQPNLSSLESEVHSVNSSP